MFSAQISSFWKVHHFCELNTWLVSLILLLTATQRFSMGFMSGEYTGQSGTVRPWPLNQLLVSLAVWAEGSIKYSRMSWLRAALTGLEKWVDQHQQMTRQPTSSLTVETSRWNSGTMDSGILSSEKLALVHTDAVIHAKGGKELRMKYKVYRNEHTFQRSDWKHPFLIGLCDVLIFWDTSFYFFIICKP